MNLENLRKGSIDSVQSSCDSDYLTMLSTETKSITSDSTFSDLNHDCLSPITLTTFDEDGVDKLTLAEFDIVENDCKTLNVVQDVPTTQLSPVKTNNCYFDNEYHVFQPKRSTSLRKGTTPPETPGCKKVVRFADAFGLDLSSIRHVFNIDLPPNVPFSAMSDLEIDGSDSSLKDSYQPQLYFSPQFSQPALSSNFIYRVLQNNVCLENVSIEDMVLSGIIRVKNLCFRKLVQVRFTYDNWCNHTDINATYACGMSDGATDKFIFNISLPPNLFEGNRIQFAIRYKIEGEEVFWDSNSGRNYIFNIVNTSSCVSDVTLALPHWAN